MELSDAELVRESLAGDKNAFGELVRKYETTIFGFALGYVKNHEEAKDITQNAFIKAYLTLKKLKDPSKFKPWLRRIAHRLCIDWLRFSKNEISFSQVFNDDKYTSESDFLPSDSPTPMEILQEKEQKMIILQAVDSLSDEFRSVIFLRYMQGLSYKEISEYLQIPLSTIKWRLHNGIRLLRNKLGKSIKG